MVAFYGYHRRIYHRPAGWCNKNRIARIGICHRPGMDSRDVQYLYRACDGFCFGAKTSGNKIHQRPGCRRSVDCFHHSRDHWCHSVHSKIVQLMNKLKYKSERPQVGKSAQMLSVLRSSGLSGFFLRTETDRVLTLSMVFSVVLVLVRIYFSGHPGFLFLVWNLFLAWLPFALTNRAQYSQKWKQGKRLVILFLAWLLFIPNAFYIITDLFHLGYHEGAPLWFDL